MAKYKTTVTEKDGSKTSGYIENGKSYYDDGREINAGASVVDSTGRTWTKGALYLLNADKTTIDKMEYKANKKVYNELIPFSKLKEMCEKHLSVAELSDYFGIPIQDVLVAEFLYNNIENYKEG